MDNKGRLNFEVLIVFVVACLFTVGIYATLAHAQALSSCVQTLTQDSAHCYTLKMVMTADTSGAFTSTSTQYAINGLVTDVAHSTGATAPTASSSITIKYKGVDIMESGLTSLANTYGVKTPLISSNPVDRQIDGKLVVDWTGNSVANAIKTLFIHFLR